MHEAPSNASLSDLLRLVCETPELVADCVLRRNEKRALNDANKKWCRFRVSGRVRTPSDKIFVLLQTSIARAKVDDVGLANDASRAVSTAERVARALLQLFTGDEVRHPASAAALTLVKCLEQRMWEDSPHELLQLPGACAHRKLQFCRSTCRVNRRWPRNVREV